MPRERSCGSHCHSGCAAVVGILVICTGSCATNFGVVSRDNESISRNISNVGLYGTEAAAGAIFFTGLLTDNPHAKETGFITAEALLNAYPVYIGMQLIAGRERPDQGAGHGRLFQD